MRRPSVAVLESGEVVVAYDRWSSKDRHQEPRPPDFDVEIAKVKDSPLPAYLKTDEQGKRFAKMAQQMGGGFSMPIKKTLMLNPSHPLVQNVLRLSEKGDRNSLVEKLCQHIEGLATIGSEGLEKEGREAFVRRSQDLITELVSAL